MAVADGSLELTSSPPSRYTTMIRLLPGYLSLSALEPDKHDQVFFFFFFKPTWVFLVTRMVLLPTSGLIDQGLYWMTSSLILTSLQLKKNMPASVCHVRNIRWELGS